MHNVFSGWSHSLVVMSLCLLISPLLLLDHHIHQLSLSVLVLLLQTRRLPPLLSYHGLSTGQSPDAFNYRVYVSGPPHHIVQTIYTPTLS